MDPPPAPQIRLAIVGIGNCASALLQGIAVATSAERPLTGVTFPSIGGYTPSSLTCVLAFDVDARKVGRPLREAVFARPNCCFEIARSPGERAALPGIQVLSAPVLDGVAPHMLEHTPASATFELTEEPPLTRAQVVGALSAQSCDVLINYLPVGSQLATEWWAEACLEAGVALCNCSASCAPVTIKPHTLARPPPTHTPPTPTNRPPAVPVFIASDPAWEAKFALAGLPLIGDDMRSQLGASVLSQVLEELAHARGHRVIAHIQQNAGGNTDFLNMQDKSRMASKKISKENVIRAPRLYMGGEEGAPAVAPAAAAPAGGGFVHAGPSDYIGHLGDNKVATFRLEMEGFGGAPLTLDARLSVEDSPNSAGVVLDAVRFLKVAREMGICGSLRGASAFTQKTPPQQLPFAAARAECVALAERRLTASTLGQLAGRGKTSTG